MTTDPATDRARLTEIRRSFPMLSMDSHFGDLLRMAEDGIAAREALARVEALCDEMDAHTGEAIAYDGMDRVARVTTDSIRRAITGGES